MSTKLSPHNLRPNVDALRLIRAGAPVAKLVDDFGAAAEYLAINPNLLIIGRRISTFPYDPGRVITAENLRHLSPSDAAQFWVETQFETYRLNPLIRYWEGPNEPVWDSLDGMRWYGAFEAERILRLNARGRFAVIGNFSTGTPHIQENDLSWWQAFMPALQAIEQYSSVLGKSVLGLHEYSDGKLSKDFDGRYGWNCFRYRRVHDWFLAPNGLGNLPIVLTEFGVDFKIRDIDYAAELAWADGEMRKDPYLLGATIFTFGSTDPAWDNFNVDGSQVTKPLVAYMESIRDAPNPIPLPTPQPEPEPEMPTFKVGDRVEVVGSNLRAREAPNIDSHINRLMNIGQQATVVSGPHEAYDVKWYGLYYDARPVEFSSGAYLKLVDVVEPPPPPPPPEPEPEPEPTIETLIFSDNFTSGVYLPNPQMDNMRVPIGWKQWFADNDFPRLSDQDESQWWTPGEGIIRDKNSLHVSELGTMLKLPDGSYAPALYHYFRGWGRLWMQLLREFELEAGRYRIEWEFWPDILLSQRIENNVILKFPDPNPLNNEFRFFVGEMFDDGNAHPAAQWTTMHREFEYRGGLINLGGEWRARWGDLVVGWFIRSFKLWKLS